MLENDQFGGATAEQDRHLVVQLFASHQEPVLGRSLYRVSESADAARNYRYLVNRVRTRQGDRDEGMAHLVMGDDLPLPWVQEPVALLETGNNALHRVGEIEHADRF